MEISKIIIYPIKSLGGIELQESEIDQFGLKYDRRWMIISSNGKALTQRENHQLSQFMVFIIDENIIISHKKDNLFQIVLPLSISTGKESQVSIWNDICIALEADDDINKSFSMKLEQDVKLVYLPAQNGRVVDTKYAKEGETTSFTDGFQILILGEESVTLLNSKLEEKVTYQRFRPNLLFKGGTPHCEDEFGNFAISKAHFKAVKPCSRCVVTTINPETSQTSKEPLKTLQTYRLINQKVMFGMNVVIKNGATIRVGDSIIL